jgi:ATP-binding cassette subfamily B protein
VAKPAREASAAQGESMATMTDGLLNYEALKCFGCERLILERFDHAVARAESEWRRFFRIRAVNSTLVATVFGTSFAIGCLYAGRRTLQGDLSVGELVLVVSYFFQIAIPTERLGAAMQQISQALAFLDKLFEILAQTPERRGDARGLHEGGGEVCFEHVSVAYTAGRSVLRGVSFRVSPGMTLGIVGMSGAGKSTLIRLLMRLIEPDEGRILLDGISIHEVSLEELRRSIAVVPQDTVLFNDTIAYNIAVGCLGSSREEIERAAKLAQLHDFVTRLPERYETRVGERGVKLSGGEKQRVAIARAALRRPRIYMFDEATSSLDSNTETGILANLREIARRSTTLIIAHRLSTVLHADEIIVLEGGSIVERGNHEALLKQNGRYAALWDAQHQSSARAIA